MACELLGYSREELLTKSPQDIDAPESQIQPDSPLILRLKAGEDVTLEQVHIVKDDPVHNSLVGSILVSLGRRVEYAADGSEAVAAFIAGKFSAIIMDMQMPVMDGIEATQRIRALETETHVPIIALTASVMPGDRDRCFAAGMDEVLSKPFKKSALAAKLAAFHDKSL